MQYIIMFLIVLGMALVDFVTGIIKGIVKDGKPDSRKMRIGGLHKLSELIVMGTAIGLKIGLEQLSAYHVEDPHLVVIACTFTVGSVFGYILLMETISILENYSEINPDTEWAKKYLKTLKKYETEGEENGKETDS